jgi:hypothetical protein
MIPETSFEQKNPVDLNNLIEEEEKQEQRINFEEKLQDTSIDDLIQHVKSGTNTSSNNLLHMRSSTASTAATATVVNQNDSDSDSDYNSDSDSDSDESAEQTAVATTKSK